MAIYSSGFALSRWCPFKRTESVDPFETGTTGYCLGVLCGMWRWIQATWTATLDWSGAITGDSPRSYCSIRMWVPAAALSAATGDQVQATVKLYAPSPGSITAMYFGQSASNIGGNKQDFQGDQVPITWSRAAAAAVSGSASVDMTIVSQAAMLPQPFDVTKDYLVAFDIAAGLTLAFDGGLTGAKVYILTGSSTAPPQDAHNTAMDASGSLDGSDEGIGVITLKVGHGNQSAGTMDYTLGFCGLGGVPPT